MSSRISAQLAELSLLRSMYPDDEWDWLHPDPATVAVWQSAVEAYTQDPEARCDDDPTLKNFRFTLRFRTDNVSDEGGSVRWQLVEAYLPPSYPDAPPEVHLRGLTGEARPVQDRINSTMKIHLAPYHGDTCLLEALQELERLVHTAVEAGELPMAKRCREPDGVVEAGANASLVECPEIRVAFVWMHHLLSTTKRKQICQWSAELGLYGLSKPGYPGVLVAEGPVSQLTEYLQRLKALKWQAFVIRHDEPSWPTAADQTKATRGRLADILCTPGVTERESISEVAAV